VTTAATLGRYSILEPIGAGRLGALYRARDTTLGRTVAVRVLADAVTADPERKECFLRRARVNTRLFHPNIATLYEVREEGPTTYLVHEYVPGQTLRSIVASGPMNPRRTLDVAAQIGAGLADAHAQDIAHGSLTLDHVIVTPRGGVKILDFGLTSEDAAVRGAEPFDEASDIRSLGLMLFEMLVGRPPEATRTPSAVNAELPRELDAIVIKASAKPPAEGYESAAALCAALREAAAGFDARQPERAAIAGAPGPSTAMQWRWVAILLVLSAVAWLLWMADRAT